MSENHRQLDDRARKAEKIIAEPAKYMICEGCDSIVAARVSVCPNCYGYRFNTDSAEVVAQARLLASREQRSVIAEDLN
jgi:RNA polymerase subunit RPABC4/transcription elongation factor Spt4